MLKNDCITLSSPPATESAGSDWAELEGPLPTAHCPLPLREWAANPLSQEMRETWFGPLIKKVEQRIIKQQGDKWNRELFEQHLMGYTMRTDRYRLVVWRDHRDSKAKPVFVELFDHQSDPSETTNIAGDHPGLVKRLTTQLDADWKAAL